MPETTSTASNVGTQVTRVLDEATATAAELLAEADHRAVRAGRDDLAELRVALEERVEDLRAARARLEKLRNETVERLREAASRIAEIPARLAEEATGPAGGAFLDREFDGGEAAKSGPPTHLVALMRAADSIAEDLTKGARRHAQQLEHLGRQEADRIASKEPKRVARAYDPAARRAESLRDEVRALSRQLGGGEQVVRGPTMTEKGSNDETGLEGPRRSSAGSSRKRR